MGRDSPAVTALGTTVDDAPSDWTQPGAYELAPGVYRIPLPLPQDGLRAVNVYAVEAGEGITLIDAGWAAAGSAAALAAGLRRVGHKVSDITDVLVTHSHGDHYTQAVDLRRIHGVHLSLGSGEQPSLQLLATSGAAVLESQRVHLLSLGAAAVVDDLARAGHQTRVPAEQWEEPDTWLTGIPRLQVGDRVLEAVPTPGHTAGHYVFADHDRRLLFAGDHVLPHITPSIGFEPVRSDFPLQDYLDSLDIVRGMEDLRLLPAHGPPSDSVHRRVDELLAHHRQRLEECREALSVDELTAYDVARRLPWTRRRKKFTELDGYNQMLATLETSAHLDVLMVDEVIERRTVHDIMYYASAAALSRLESR